ncbi:hypothetical protein SMICM17S_01733 [Streptomyces microflavus]
MFVDETSAALATSDEAMTYLANRFGLTVDQAVFNQPKEGSVTEEWRSAPGWPKYR